MSMFGRHALDVYAAVPDDENAPAQHNKGNHHQHDAHPHRGSDHRGDHGATAISATAQHHGGNGRHGVTHDAHGMSSSAARRRGDHAYEEDEEEAQEGGAEDGDPPHPREPQRQPWQNQGHSAGRYGQQPAIPAALPHRDDSLASALHDQAMQAGVKGGEDGGGGAGGMVHVQHHEIIFPGRHRDEHLYPTPLTPRGVALYNNTHHQHLHARVGDVVPTDDVYIDEVGPLRADAQRRDHEAELQQQNRHVVRSELSDHELPAFIPGKSITNAEASAEMNRLPPEHVVTQREMQDKVDAMVGKIMLPNAVFQGTAGDYSFLNPGAPPKHPGSKGVINALVETDRELEVFARIAHGRVRHQEQDRMKHDVSEDEQGLSQQREDGGGVDNEEDEEAQMPHRQHPHAHPHTHTHADDTSIEHHEKPRHVEDAEEGEFGPGKHVQLVHAVRDPDLDLKPLTGHDGDMETGNSRANKSMNHTAGPSSTTGTGTHDVEVHLAPRQQQHPRNKTHDHHFGYFPDEQTRYEALHRRWPSCALALGMMCESGRTCLLMLVLFSIGAIVIA